MALATLYTCGIAAAQRLVRMFDEVTRLGMRADLREPLPDIHVRFLVWPQLQLLLGDLAPPPAARPL